MDKGVDFIIWKYVWWNFWEQYVFNVSTSIRKNDLKAYLNDGKKNNKWENGKTQSKILDWKANRSVRGKVKWRSSSLRSWRKYRALLAGSCGRSGFITQVLEEVQSTPCGVVWEFRAGAGREKLAAPGAHAFIGGPWGVLWGSWARARRAEFW